MDAYLLPRDVSGLEKVGKTKDGQQLYAYGGSGCVSLVLPNGQFVIYQSKIPTIKDPEGTGGAGVTPDITWSSAIEQTKGMRYNDRAIGGCGASGCTDVVTDAEVGPMSGLMVAGIASNGDTVYTPASPTKHPLVKAAYDNWYVPEGSGETKSSLATFVKEHPTALLFWKDAFGRWTLLTTIDAMPMTECGKPVIYLYPQQTERVSVALPSFINVTKSEPTYPSKGWVVTAHPDGALEYADGNTYSSLYWEGTGVGYETPKDGFIIKDGNVDKKLTELLARYGLNAKESQEFRDFWVPKMTGAPYYRVSFLTSDWSEAAPLSVFPHPQTSIRIFMDWQKLDAPISIPEPKIVTPVRNGFTLVEWGGLIRK